LLFLQVTEGTAIAIDKIKMIKKSGEMSTKVHTSSDVYELPIPFSTLMSLLHEDTSDNDKITRMLNIMKEMGVPTP